MIGTTHEKERERKKVNLINKLIENSFGERFSGDWTYNQGFERGDKLNIVRKEKEGFFKHGKNPYAAIFTDKDGSSMTVFPEHYISAIKYSLLYEKIFGKEVEIRAPEGCNLY